MKRCLITMAFLVGMTLFMGCPQDDGGSSFFGSQYEPIYLERSVFEQSITQEAVRTIENSGKIYVFDNLLFVNEKYEGFHVFSNVNPSNPEPIGFIKIPGVTDVSIRNGVYYFNQAVDLVAVEYNPLTTAVPIVTKRIKNTFPPILSPDGFQLNSIPENNVIVGWQLIQ